MRCRLWYLSEDMSARIGQVQQRGRLTGGLSSVQKVEARPCNGVSTDV